MKREGGRTSVIVFVVVAVCALMAIAFGVGYFLGKILL